mmetsp:Transcript_4898/g.21082  ORF Transcript_4898/g.21082 Transcript_4898/m.21082 type:complete len:247 (+) Transcript_4898:2073-2813(+)
MTKSGSTWICSFSDSLFIAKDDVSCLTLASTVPSSAEVRSTGTGSSTFFFDLLRLLRLLGFLDLLVYSSGESGPWKSIVSGLGLKSSPASIEGTAPAAGGTLLTSSSGWAGFTISGLSSASALIWGDGFSLFPTGIVGLSALGAGLEPPLLDFFPFLLLAIHTTACLCPVSLSPGRRCCNIGESPTKPTQFWKPTMVQKIIKKEASARNLSLRIRLPSRRQPFLSPPLFLGNAHKQIRPRTNPGEQ